MKFSDYAGSITIDPNHFKAFAYAWFEPDDLVSIVAMPVSSGGNKNMVPSQVLPIKELVTITAQELENLCYLDEDRSQKCNMYMGISPIKEGIVLSDGSRGKEDDFRGVYGAFADLDIESPGKPGYFKSKDEIKEFLCSLDYPPTILVDNGISGGMHAYWRLNKGEISDKELLLRWWTYLTSKTERKIDKLTDITRISRMPSCIYWAKREGDITDTVKVITNSGPYYSLDSFLSITNESFEAYKTKKKKVIDHESQRKWSLPNIASEIYRQHSGDGYNWSALRLMAFIEDIYNEKVDWEDILIPNGWTFLRDLGDGSREWARPGRNERSAVTDYDHGTGEISPVMSLLSTSEESLLYDLRDAGIPLTKYRVSLRLDFDDNEEAFMEYIKKNVLGL